MCLEEPATEQVTDRMTLVFPPSWLDRSDEMKSIVHENVLFKKVESIIFVNIIIVCGSFLRFTYSIRRYYCLRNGTVVNRIILILFFSFDDRCASVYMETVHTTIQQITTWCDGRMLNLPKIMIANVPCFSLSRDRN